MTSSPDLPVAARVCIDLGLHRAGPIKSIAVALATRFVLEFHRAGFNEPGWAVLQRVSARWRLGDYCTALLAHYPPRFVRAGGRVEYIGVAGRPVAEDGRALV